MSKRDPQRATEELIRRNELELKWLREDFDYADRNNAQAQPTLARDIELKTKTIERLRRFQKMVGWSVTNGTPKTLLQAIENGVKAGDEADCPIIEMHVRDFLAQRFSVALMKAEAWGPAAEHLVSELYEEITGRKVK